MNDSMKQKIHTYMYRVSIIFVYRACLRIIVLSITEINSRLEEFNTR